MATGNIPARTSHLKNKDQESGTAAWLGTNLVSDIKVHVSRTSSSHMWYYDLSKTHVSSTHQAQHYNAHLCCGILLHFYFNTKLILAIKPWVNIPPGQMPKQTSILSLLPKVKFHYLESLFIFSLTFSYSSPHWMHCPTLLPLMDLSFIHFPSRHSLHAFTLIPSSPRPTRDRASLIRGGPGAITEQVTIGEEKPLGGLFSADMLLPIAQSQGREQQNHHLYPFLPLHPPWRGTKDLFALLLESPMWGLWNEESFLGIRSKESSEFP